MDNSARRRSARIAGLGHLTGPRLGHKALGAAWLRVIEAAWRIRARERIGRAQDWPDAQRELEICRSFPAGATDGALQALLDSAQAAALSRSLPWLGQGRIGLEKLHRANVVLLKFCSYHDNQRFAGHGMQYVRALEMKRSVSDGFSHLASSWWRRILQISVRRSLPGIRAGVIACAAVLLACCSAGTGEPQNTGSPLRMRLMTGQQYSNTIAYIFGEDISAAVPAPVPPITRTSGLLAVGAASIGVTPDQLQEIQQAAAAVAAKAVDEEHRRFLIPCTPANDKAADSACAQQFLEHAAPLWYRHPLDKDQLKAIVNQANTAAGELKNFYAGLSSAIEGMLVSPEALFVIDRDEQDPENKGQRRLDAYSLASRLSFFLWNAAPDEKLLAAAQSGELQTKTGRARVVDAMLASSRLEAGMRAFFDDMMVFNDFDSLSKDAQVYPSVTGATLTDAREQTLRTVIDHLITRRADYRDLFTTRRTFMSMNLAPIYGVSTQSDDWVPYEFPLGSARSGLLTQVSFLAAHAHPARSSSTRRGKALRELFLCQIVPTPPPNVDFSKLDDPDPSLRTARERLAAHVTNPSCAGCHKIMDPMGLALEHFDGAGQFRATENGAPLDTSGALDGKTFKDVAGLGQALHDNPGVPSCLVNRLYSYGTGGTISPVADKPALDFFKARFEKAGYKLPDLLRDIAISDAFARVRPSARKTETNLVVAAGTQPAH